MGVIDSAIPTLSVAEKCVVGDLHLAFFVDKEVVKGHAQWWRSEMKEKIDTQTRKGSGAPFLLGDGGPVLSLGVSGECCPGLGQDLTEERERTRVDLVRKADEKGLDVWKHVKVFPPVKMGSQSKDVADTRWALTWGVVEGAKTVRARLVAKGDQGPDLRNGNLDIAGCVSRRWPHIQLISLGALKKWAIWSLDIQDAFPRPDGLGR